MPNLLHRALDALPLLLSRLDRRLPSGRCFVSHRYAESTVLESLRAKCHPATELVTFPSVPVPTTTIVSDRFLPVIRTCQCLIFIAPSQVLEYRWVTLEVDYAKRHRIPTF